MCYKNNLACGIKPSNFHTVHSVQHSVITTAERDYYAAHTVCMLKLSAQDSTISEV